MSARPLQLHADRLFPADPRTRDIARALYASVADLPIALLITIFRPFMSGWDAERWAAALAPLLPLSLVLGCVFERRHNYATVVVIHGLFNATMLALALLTVE